tara:strand:- start:2731 stop:3627 length:897 start_codon:yes stop_codon:yes gene_type:complete
METPPPSPPGTPTRFNTYAPPPSVVKKHEKRGINKMDNAIEIIVGMSKDRTRIGEFGQKLNSQQTKYFDRANQSSTTRVYIDKPHVNPRLVYKLGTKSKIQREIQNYEKLEIIDDAREHILRRVGGLIEIPGTDVAMFITLHQDGLTSDNLLYNPDNTKFPQNYEDLAVEAEEYLKRAGLEHDDIAGNLYVINGTYFWIDFEEMKGQSSWFQFNHFSPTKRPRDPDSPAHNTSTEASTSSSSDSPYSDISDSSLGTKPMPPPHKGGKSRKKRSRKSKKHKKKSHKYKSRKNISKKSKK